MFQRFDPRAFLKKYPEFNWDEKKEAEDDDEDEEDVPELVKHFDPIPPPLPLNRVIIQPLAKVRNAESSPEETCCQVLTFERLHSELTSWDSNAFNLSKCEQIFQQLSNPNGPFQIQFFGDIYSDTLPIHLLQTTNQTKLDFQRFLTQK